MVLRHWRTREEGRAAGEIATPELDQQLAQAEADLATAKATANNAHAQAQRYTDLVESNAVSQQDTRPSSTRQLLQLVGAIGSGQRAAAERTAIV